MDAKNGCEDLISTHELILRKCQTQWNLFQVLSKQSLFHFGQTLLDDRSV